MSPSAIPSTRSIIRTGRPASALTNLAAAFALSVALSGFILVGGLILPGEQTSAAYLLALLLFVPVALTYLQYFTAARSSQRIFDLFAAHGYGARTFVGGWLLYIGYAALLALTAWGAGALLSALAQQLLDLSLSIRLAALAIVLLAAIFESIALVHSGAARNQSRAVYVAIFLALLALGLADLTPTNPLHLLVSTNVSRSSMVATMAAGYWVISLLLNGRSAPNRPRGSTQIALLLPTIVGALVGITVSLLPLYPFVLWPATSNGIAVLRAELNPAYFALAFFGGGLVLTLIAMKRVLHHLVALHRAMAETGLLPGRTIDGPPDQEDERPTWVSAAIPLIALLMAGIGVVAAPVGLLTAVAALGFLWPTVLLNAINFARPQRQMPRRGAIPLPFHPLFPGLVVLIGLVLSSGLAIAAQIFGLVWLAVGGVLYFVYGHRRSAQLLETHSARYGMEPAGHLPHVLVNIVEPRRAIALIQAGASVAKSRQIMRNEAGDEDAQVVLLVLSVIEAPPNMPENLKQFRAQEQLAVMDDWIDRSQLDPDQPARACVRTATSVVAGVVETIHEEQAELLVLVWDKERHAQILEKAWDRVLESEPAAESAPDPTEPAEESTADGNGQLPARVATILQAAPCDVLLLHGDLPRSPRRIAVVNAANAADQRSLDAVAASLSMPGTSEVIHLSRPVAAPTAPDADGATPSADASRAHTNESIRKLLRDTQRADLLLMSTPRQGVLDSERVNAAAIEAAQRNRRTTLLLRPYDGAIRFRLRAVWRALSDIFPTLTDIDRGDVSSAMHRAAYPTIDFFVLISLSAMIATLGLLQNSAAVIIGAMLVAPLMSPIISTAMGVVEGDTDLMRVGLEATTKGVAVAIGVGALISLLAPSVPGSEIINRTQPNLLDLVVALASGAAGGYALARKEVSASLPGVSIAVALVPPLCVVGYGIANVSVLEASTGDVSISGLEIAGGALLLFLTNMAAIILAAAVVFLILGFRPSPETMTQFRRGLIYSTASLLLVALALSALVYASVDQMGQQARQTEIRQQAAAILADIAERDQAELVSFEITETDEGYLVKTTIHNLGAFDGASTDQLRQRLADELGQPVQVQATILDARLIER